MSTGPIDPDTKDWTWVLIRPCPDCGFDPAAWASEATGKYTVHHTAIAEHIAGDATHWVDRLTRSGVRQRPAPGVWSILEYGCHIRDVHRVFDQRVRLMLNEDEPRFPNWDQDATALADDYPSQNPAVVARELFDAATTVAQTYRQVPEGAWARRGLRSNGSEFTIATIAVYHLHDIVHHAWDVTGELS